MLRAWADPRHVGGAIFALSSALLVLALLWAQGIDSHPGMVLATTVLLRAVLDWGSDLLVGDQ